MSQPKDPRPTLPHEGEPLQTRLCNVEQDMNEYASNGARKNRRIEERLSRIEMSLYGFDYSDDTEAAEPNRK